MDRTEDRQLIARLQAGDESGACRSWQSVMARGFSSWRCAI